MSKVKGNRTERELLHLFWSAGYGVSRVAGSGSTPLPSPDLIAGKEGKLFAIECKAGKGTRYLSKKEINELEEFSSRIGAEALVAARFNNAPWIFLKISDLGVSRTGENYFVNLKLAKEKGVLFKDLVK